MVIFNLYRDHSLYFTCCYMWFFLYTNIMSLEVPFCIWARVFSKVIISCRYFTIFLIIAPRMKWWELVETYFLWLFFSSNVEWEIKMLPFGYYIFSLRLVAVDTPICSSFLVTQGNGETSVICPCNFNYVGFDFISFVYV